MINFNTNELNIVIPICDENLHILPLLYKMYNKYWNHLWFKFHIIGFKEPEFKFDSVKWQFHSMGSYRKGGVQSWSKYIAKFLKTTDFEYCIFALEDFIPTDYININQICEVLEKIIFRGETVDRFELGFDIYSAVEHEVIENHVYYNILKAKQNTMYRISTQTSLWNREFLIKYLDHYWTPWEFEIEGSIMSTFDTKANIIGCGDIEFKSFPARWIHKGMISRQQPGKYNILGLKLSDIKELCDENYFKQEDLIMGMWPGYVPTFNELGGFNLDWNLFKSKFKSIECIKQYTHYNWKEYDIVYNPVQLI